VGGIGHCANHASITAEPLIDPTGTAGRVSWPGKCGIALRAVTSPTTDRLSGYVDPGDEITVKQTKSTSPEQPLGPRKLDLGALTDEDFELLCLLVVLLEYPEAVKLGRTPMVAPTQLYRVARAGITRGAGSSRGTRGRSTGLNASSRSTVR
jgi:hypothetical protein